MSSAFDSFFISFYFSGGVSPPIAAQSHRACSCVSCGPWVPARCLPHCFQCPPLLWGSSVCQNISLFSEQDGFVWVLSLSHSSRFSLWLWFSVQLSCCSHSYSELLKCHSSVHAKRYPGFLIHCLLGHCHPSACCSCHGWRALSCPRKLIYWGFSLVFLPSWQWRATRNH